MKADATARERCHSGTGDRAKQQAETEAILAALNTTRWNRKKAAALLKIDYKALLYKMKKLGVEGDSPDLPDLVRAVRLDS